MCASTRPACSSLHRLRSNGVERDSWINRYDIAVHRAPLTAPPSEQAAPCRLQLAGTQPAADRRLHGAYGIADLTGCDSRDQECWSASVNHTRPRQLSHACPPKRCPTRRSSYQTLVLLRCPRGRLGRVHPREPNIEKHWSQNSARRGVDLHCILNAPNVASYLRITGGPLRAFARK